MTTEPALADLFQRLAPRGSLIRFGIAGGFNSVVFLLAWAGSIVLFPDVEVKILWGVFWGLTGLFAHFVHRWFTFDRQRPVAHTLSVAIPIYVIGLVGSSISIGWLASWFPNHLVLMGVLNTLAWGAVIWLMTRIWVFKYAMPTVRASQESPAE